MPEPRSDYLCERCHDSGKMPTPVELPVSAKHCPVCGRKKWLIRIWSAQISTAREKVKAHEQIVEPAWTQAMAVKDAAKDSRSRFAANPFKLQVVPVNELGGLVGAPLDLGKGTPGTDLATPALRPIHGQLPRMAPGSRVDRETRVPRG